MGMDESVRKVIRKLISGMDGAPKEENLQLEIGKALTGESSYSADDLSQVIRTIKARIGETEEKPEGLRAEAI